MAGGRAGRPGEAPGLAFQAPTWASAALRSSWGRLRLRGAGCGWRPEDGAPRPFCGPAGGEGKRGKGSPPRAAGAPANRAAASGAARFRRGGGGGPGVGAPGRGRSGSGRAVPSLGSVLLALEAPRLLIARPRPRPGPARPGPALCLTGCLLHLEAQSRDPPRHLWAARDVLR